MPRPPNSFRLQAKNIFITYPQCSLLKEDVLEFIKNLNYMVVRPKYIRVSHERHSDGNSHLHCLLQLTSKSNIKNPRFFDIPNPSSSTPYHPNIQPARDANAVQGYISKDGDYCEWGQFSPVRARSLCKEEVYNNARNASSSEEAMAIIRAGDARSFILQYHNISANLANIFKVPPPPYVSPFTASSFNNVPEEIEEWAATNVMSAAARPKRPKSIVIEGPTRTGKTEWARSLGPHNYLCGHLDLNSKVFSNDAWYNVIDDVNPQYLKHWKEFFGSQKNWQSNTKYGKPVLIKGGIPTIFLCNPGEGSSYKDFLDEPKNSNLRQWTLGNAVFFTISQPFFLPVSSPQTEDHPQDSQEEQQQA